MNKFAIKIGNFNYSENNGICTLFYNGSDVSGLDLNKIWREEIQAKREEIQKVINTVKNLSGVFQMEWTMEDINLHYNCKSFDWNGVKGTKDVFLENMGTIFYENEHSHDKDESDLSQLHDAVTMFRKM